MSLTPATIKSANRSKRTSKRVGRGNGSGKGSYSTRGGKGQTARSGGGSRTQIRAFKHQLLKVPKLRGFKSFKNKAEAVTLKSLNTLFNDNDKITPKVLKHRGLVGSTKAGVKILASGELTKKFIIEGCLASKKAVEMIEKAGGKILF